VRNTAQRNTTDATAADANEGCEIRVTPDALLSRNDDVDLASGAVVEFHGVVRAFEDGREISGIEYEAHSEMAQHQLRSIAEHAIERFGLTKVILHHRTGFVAAGEPSLLLRVASAHRAAAFDASKWVVDELKQKVPIWKRPVYLQALAK
jgi:molybdopterin synthase catalytic subunit